MLCAVARQRAYLVAWAVAIGLIGAMALVPSALAFPGQNGKIAFSSFRDGNFETYAMSDTGAGQVNVSNHPDFDYGPSWSPDGDEDRVPHQPRRHDRDLRHERQRDGRHPPDQQHRASTGSPRGRRT